MHTQVSMVMIWLMLSLKAVCLTPWSETSLSMSVSANATLIGGVRLNGVKPNLSQRCEYDESHDVIIRLSKRSVRNIKTHCIIASRFWLPNVVGSVFTAGVSFQGLSNASSIWNEVWYGLVVSLRLWGFSECPCGAVVLLWLFGLFYQSHTTS